MRSNTQLSAFSMPRYILRSVVISPPSPPVPVKDGDLRSHQQRTVESVASDILGRQAGDQIKTMAEYQREVGVGSGTVQKALTFLESVGAVSLSRHGHQGTRIVELDRSALWGFTGRGHVRIVSTLPGAIDAFGLTKGLEEQFASFGIPVGLQYQRGADARAERVRKNRADVAIVSKGAAAQLSSRRRSKTTMVELANGSYYALGSLVRLERTGSVSRPLRVGIDRRSPDHQTLTELEFSADDRRWTYVDCPYSGLPGALLSDQVDLGIWHRTLLPAPVESLGLRERPLSAHGADQLLQQISPAVLIARSADAALHRLLEEVDVRAVTRTQKSLLAMDPASAMIHDAVWSR